MTKFYSTVITIAVSDEEIIESLGLENDEPINDEDYQRIAYDKLFNLDFDYEALEEVE